MFDYPSVVSMGPKTSSNSCNCMTKDQWYKLLGICLKKKYAFWVTLRPPGYIRQGKAKLLHYVQNWATHTIKITSVFHHHPSADPKHLCTLAYLLCTHEADTSYSVSCFMDVKTGNQFEAILSIFDYQKLQFIHLKAKLNSWLPKSFPFPNSSPTNTKSTTLSKEPGKRPQGYSHFL